MDGCGHVLVCVPEGCSHPGSAGRPGSPTRSKQTKTSASCSSATVSPAWPFPALLNPPHCPSHSSSHFNTDGETGCQQIRRVMNKCRRLALLAAIGRENLIPKLSVGPTWSYSPGATCGSGPRYVASKAGVAAARSSSHCCAAAAAAIRHALFDLPEVAAHTARRPGRTDSGWSGAQISSCHQVECWSGDYAYIIIKESWQALQQKERPVSLPRRRRRVWCHQGAAGGGDRGPREPRGVPAASNTTLC